MIAGAGTLTFGWYLIHFARSGDEDGGDSACAPGSTRVKCLAPWRGGRVAEGGGLLSRPPARGAAVLSAIRARQETHRTLQANLDRQSQRQSSDEMSGTMA